MLVDIDCKGERTSSTGHIQVAFVSSEKAQGQCMSKP